MGRIVGFGLELCCDEKKKITPFIITGREDIGKLKDSFWPSPPQHMSFPGL